MTRAPEYWLVATEARYQQAHAASDVARLAREDAIREAAANGLSTRHIAQFVSVTWQRVQQIIAAGR